MTTSISPTTVIKANDAWRSHSLCQRIEYILDNVSPRKHASSNVARKALRWTRILIRMDHRSKPTSHWKRYSDKVQFGELRSDRGSSVIKSSPMLPSSTSSTPSRQEIYHPKSSSSSSTSPTMTSSTVSSESVARQERRDPCGIDSYTATVSNKHVEWQRRRDRALPTNRNGCKSSERILWKTEFLNIETNTPVLLMNHL